MKKSGRREKRKCHVAASRVPVRTAFLFALIVMTRQVCMYVNVRWFWSFLPQYPKLVEVLLKNLKYLGLPKRQF